MSNRPVLAAAAAALFAGAALATPQCRLVPVDQARRATELLSEGGQFVTWCQPCGQQPSPPQPVQRTSVVTSGPDSATVSVNEVQVDLASTYAWVPGARAFRNVALSVGCNAAGVSPNLPAPGTAGMPAGPPPPGHAAAPAIPYNPGGMPAGPPPPGHAAAPALPYSPPVLLAPAQPAAGAVPMGLPPGVTPTPFPGGAQPAFPGALHGDLDPRSLADLSTVVGCQRGGRIPGCERRDYDGLYADLDGDGRMDLLASTVEGFVPSWVGLWSDVNGAHLRVYAGACNRFHRGGGTFEFLCETGRGTDVLLVRPMAVRPAAGDASRQEAQAEVARHLRNLYVAEMSHFAERNRFTADLDAVGFDPPAGNRYAYFASAPGSLRPEPGSDGVPYSIVPADQVRFPAAVTPRTPQEVGCPVTFGADESGESVGLGPTRSGQAFTAYAAANLDADGTWDCWSVSSVNRVSRDGNVIRAGEPFHEQAD